MKTAKQIFTIVAASLLISSCNKVYQYECHCVDMSGRNYPDQTMVTELDYDDDKEAAHKCNSMTSHGPGGEDYICTAKKAGK